MEFAAAALSQIGTALASGASAVGSAVTGAAAGGSVASILSGGATALSILYGISAGDEKATSMELAAGDASREGDIESLQGLQRRTQLRSALASAIGEQETAYAGSGADLSWGTPAQARQDAQREAGNAITTDSMTTMSRISRLNERSRLLKAQAKSTRRGALLQGLVQGLSYGSDLAERGGPKSPPLPRARPMTGDI